MTDKVTVDTHLLDELLLDVLLQCCGNKEGTEIDNMCLSAYEEACDYLTGRGYLLTHNGRVYKIRNAQKTATTQGEGK